MVFCLTIIYYFELFSLHVTANSRKCHFKNPYRALFELLETENFPFAQPWWATILNDKNSLTSTKRVVETIARSVPQKAFYKKNLVTTESTVTFIYRQFSKRFFFIEKWNSEKIGYNFILFKYSEIMNFPLKTIHTHAIFNVDWFSLRP